MEFAPHRRAEGRACLSGGFLGQNTLTRVGVGGQDGVPSWRGEHVGVPPYRLWSGRSYYWTPPCGVLLNAACTVFDMWGKCLPAPGCMHMPYVMSGSPCLNACLDEESKFMSFHLCMNAPERRLQVMLRALLA